MKFIKTTLQDLVIIEPRVFKDGRGYFMESFRMDLFEKEIGKINFIQENESYSKYGVLRGLHYQVKPFDKSKLVHVVSGKVIDVAVDIRHWSSTCGKHISVELSEENKRQIFIPRGFAHGYVVISEFAIFQYKVDNYYNKESETGIRWDDKNLAINWPIEKKDILISDKDALLPSYEGAKIF